MMDKPVHSHNHIRRITLGWVLFTALSFGAAADDLPALASYRATYDIELVRAAQLEGLRAASGKMTYALADRCDGYTIETDVDLNLAFSNGLTNRVVKHYAGWESKDGRRSTFRMQIYENGEPEDAYTGTVELDAEGAGKAVYNGPETIGFDLPKGTILSSRQLRELIRAAQAATPFLAQSVMDGAFEEGPYRTTGFIAPAREIVLTPTPIDSVSSRAAASLLSGRYWPVTLAYFPLDKNPEVPDYELSVQLLANGVIRSMTQDYGAYTLSLQLTGLAPVDGGC